MFFWYLCCKLYHISIMQTIVIHLDEDKSAKIKKYLQDMKVSFEVKDDESTYDPKFVEKIEHSKQQALKGNERTISLDEIWK